MGHSMGVVGVRVVTWIALVATVMLLGCARTSTRGNLPGSPDAVEDGGILSLAPTDLEFQRAALFDEPLAPLGGATSPDENRALSTALRASLRRSDPYNTDDIEVFLRDHPNSPWRASLLTNLGILWRRTGRYGQALDAWERAWTLSRAEIAWRGRAIADRAVSEFALLNAQLGRRDRLTALFEELRPRPPVGSAAERLGLAQIGWATMAVHPERSFRCGPFAVRNVWRVLHPRDEMPQVLTETRSSAQGTLLAELTALAAQTGEPMRPVFRAPGTSFAVPSVLHWRVNHFAAIVAVEESATGERVYVLHDPTFGGEVRTTERWLDDETSGYMLVPARVERPSAWRDVADDEAATVWGRGEFLDLFGDAFGLNDLRGGGSCGMRGMATHDFHTHLAALHVSDTPVWLNSAYGPAVELKISYNQADWFQSQNPQTTSFGGRWTHNWASYIDGEITNNQLAVHMGSGGIVRHHFVGGVWQPEERGGDVLQVVGSGSPPSTIRLLKRGGGVETYALLASAFAPRWYLTSVQDPQGKEPKKYNLGILTTSLGRLAAFVLTRLPRRSRATPWSLAPGALASRHEICRQNAQVIFFRLLTRSTSPTTPTVVSRASRTLQAAPSSSPIARTTRWSPATTNPTGSPNPTDDSPSSSTRRCLALAIRSWS